MSITARKLPETMTTAEFLRWQGDGTDTRYELVDGHLVAMSPATSTHGTIQASMALLLGSHLKDSRCRVLTEAAVIPNMAADINVRVPDLAVTCAPDVPGEVGLTNPILIVEILSAGNKQKTWTNVWAFASIPSLREILILSSWSIEAQLLRRDQTGAWPPTAETISADGSITLASIDQTFDLKDAYDKTYLVA
ncbi:MAG: Uma2 family endonuclease [Hyphomicrobiaceae bacterium]|nr:Uma2 family endonuclease [Hyphomicrobiaceae bacterium]